MIKVTKTMGKTRLTNMLRVITGKQLSDNEMQMVSEARHRIIPFAESIVALPELLAKIPDNTAAKNVTVYFKTTNTNGKFSGYERVSQTVDSRHNITGQELRYYDTEGKLVGRHLSVNDKEIAASLERHDAAFIYNPNKWYWFWGIRHSYTPYELRIEIGAEPSFNVSRYPKRKEPCSCPLRV